MTRSLDREPRSPLRNSQSESAYGLELDPKYIDVIVQRWQTLSGKRAKLDGDGRTFEEIASERKVA
jgi:DNA modification methylase